MIRVQFGTYQIKNADVLPFNIYQQPLKLSWEAQPQTLYSIFIIGQKGITRTLHYAIINIPGSDLVKGNTLAGYLPLTSNSDQYNIYVYRQSYPIVVKNVSNRSSFNLDQMVAENALILDEMIYFLTLQKLNGVIPAIGKNGVIPAIGKNGVIPAIGKNGIIPPPPLTPLPITQTPLIAPPPITTSKLRTTIRVSPGAVKGTVVKSGYFKDLTDLTDGDQKYCRCVLHVLAKQNKGCLENKAWFKDIDGKRCYNPYAVCAKSTRHSSRQCGVNYNWEGIPDNELEGYANINHIPVPTPYNRTQMINNILAWKKSKYKN